MKYEDSRIMVLDRKRKKQREVSVRVIPEDKIHKGIADYLNLVIKRPSRWHTVEVSQGGGKAAMYRQIALKRKGVVTGWPDIEIFWVTNHNELDATTRMIFLEVKILGEEPKPHQLALHNELREDGHLVAVVRSIADVEAFLKQCGMIKGKP